MGDGKYSCEVWYKRIIIVQMQNTNIQPIANIIIANIILTILLIYDKHSSLILYTDNKIVKENITIRKHIIKIYNHKDKKLKVEQSQMVLKVIYV